MVLDGLNRMSANGVHGVMSLCSWVIQCNACHGVVYVSGMSMGLCMSGGLMDLRMSPRIW